MLEELPILCTAEVTSTYTAATSPFTPNASLIAPTPTPCAPTSSLSAPTTTPSIVRLHPPTTPAPSTTIPIAPTHRSVFAYHRVQTSQECQTVDHNMSQGIHLLLYCHHTHVAPGNGGCCSTVNYFSCTLKPIESFHVCGAPLHQQVPSLCLGTLE